MKIVTWIKGLFSKKETLSDFDRMQHLVVYKSEIDYFDRIKLAKKMAKAQDVVKATVEDEWFTINWSRVSEDVKRQCIELAKVDIANQIELIK
jgi:hypothetical protein